MELHQYSITSWFMLFVGILILFLIYLNKKVRYWKDRGIPTSVNGIWSIILGIRMFMTKPLHLLQMESYKKHGRIYGITMGFTPQLSIAEPHILKNILVKDFNMFHNRMKFKLGNPMFDKMLSILEDEDWKRIRCIVSPTFTSSRMRKMAYLIRECAEKFIENLNKIVDKNENLPIDCKKYLSSYSLDVIASAAFGTKLSSLDDPNNEFVNKARQATNTDASFLNLLGFIFPNLVRMFRIDIFRGAFDFFKDFTLHVVKQRETTKTNANDFLRLLMDAQKGVLEISPEEAKEDNIKEQSDYKILPKHKTMSTDEMLAQCLLFLFAGNETNTNTLAFLMFYLALHPEYQDKLIQEIDEVWNTTKDVNFDTLNKMPYLDAVISETLRKEPIAIQLDRDCTEEYELSDIGFKIPKGMHIVVPVYAMHHDKEFFPNPEKFDPERFLPENRSSIPAYAYLPFGDGPRNCVGMRFALMMIKMCVFHIFRDFRVHATEETKKPLEFFIGQGLLQPKKVIVKMEKRK